MCHQHAGVGCLSVASWHMFLAYLYCPAGSKSQDDAAEDPLTAIKQGLTPNYQLYW